MLEQYPPSILPGATVPVEAYLGDAAREGGRKFFTSFSFSFKNLLSYYSSTSAFIYTTGPPPFHSAITGNEPPMVRLFSAPDLLYAIPVPSVHGKARFTTQARK